MTSSTLFLVKKLILNLLIIYKSNILASTFSTLFLQKFYFQSPIPKLTLLQESLPATPKDWKELITDMTNFSNLLERYFLTIFFSLQGPYPSSPNPDNSKPLYLLRFNYHRDNLPEDLTRNFFNPDNFLHPDPVKK